MYKTTENPDKGLKGGSCNRMQCQAPGAFWYNKGTYKYYCTKCANLINEHASSPKGGGEILCTYEGP